MKYTLEHQPRLDLKQGQVAGLLVDDGVFSGITTNLGVRYKGKVGVITTGTFLKGLMHVGDKNVSGGRMGSDAAFQGERGGVMGEGDLVKEDDFPDAVS